MPASQKDVIANYLMQYLVEGNDCDRPMEIPQHWGLNLLARNNLSRLSFEQQSPSNRKEFISSGVLALTLVLHSGDFQDFDSDSVNELCLKLEDVYNRKSQTLRPLLDTPPIGGTAEWKAVARGFYPDPDAASTVRLEGKPSRP